jgi:hydroxymethylpyrimidine/phosphomethylpyrimidine kinase
LKGRVLIVAGSDSGGGAGLQADLKTVTILGGFAMTAVTAITVQNTLGVFGVHPIPPETIAAQIEAVSSDIGIDCVKIGMLGTAGAVHCVADALDRAAPGVPRVVDPVMVAKGGHPLLEPDAVAAILARLVPGSALVTPNAPEAEALTGLAVVDSDCQRAAAERLIAQGARAALVKGGHLKGEILRDVLVTEWGHTFILESPRIATRATHGTGCTYASAIAAFLARGADLETAIRGGHAYLAEAIRRAPGLGAGHGPLAHGWPVEGATLRGTD